MLDQICGHQLLNEVFKGDLSLMFSSLSFCDACLFKLSDFQSANVSQNPPITKYIALQRGVVILLPYEIQL